MDERKSFDEAINFRMFSDEVEQVEKTVIHAKTPEGWRKYDNFSHFVRCAVIKLINEEKKRLEVTKGRPKKYSDKD